MLPITDLKRIPLKYIPNTELFYKIQDDHEGRPILFAAFAGNGLTLTEINHDTASLYIRTTIDRKLELFCVELKDGEPSKGKIYLNSPLADDFSLDLVVRLLQEAKTPLDFLCRRELYQSGHYSVAVAEEAQDIMQGLVNVPKSTH